jgi:hypothetical protein
MMQAVAVHRAGDLRDVPMKEYLPALEVLAKRKRLSALREALRQRYPKRA